MTTRVTRFFNVLFSVSDQVFSLGLVLVGVAYLINGDSFEALVLVALGNLVRPQ